MSDTLAEVLHTEPFIFKSRLIKLLQDGPEGEGKDNYLIEMNIALT
jgi:hypothetical protein